jgi:hypothetical protein
MEHLLQHFDLTVPVLIQMAGYLIMLIGFAAVGVITQSNTFQGTDFFSTELIAATADTSITIAHGLGAIKAAAGSGIAGLAPLDYTLTPIVSADFYLSKWRVVSINTTNIVVAKSTTSLSGAATPQVKVIVRRPHSIGR